MSEMMVVGICILCMMMDILLEDLTLYMCI